MYAEGEYLRFDRGFVYIALVYNVSISLSIYALVRAHLFLVHVGCGSAASCGVAATQRPLVCGRVSTQTCAGALLHSNAG
jgi:hypothetical protein